MTPALNILKKAKIPHEVLSYKHTPNAPAYGLEAAEKLQLPPEQVFKTLILNCDAQLVVAIIPVDHQVSLKALAKHCGVKKAEMAEPMLVTKKTGYILGGVSPLGQKVSLQTVLDNSAASLAKIYVSAGKRGLEIGLAPTDLQHLTQATFANIGIPRYG
ncbi:Cys-tRNA(Pro) deacylase [Opacimonas viscosa]|uniref:Cys-tRNA(Pro)/Cys-tRNA(Cys) deacylase n=1 Tax=Opacimonas viscosa TaxID=2961944 RepID=A0AA41X1V0_9ALTE|nr:Cys-tRNA(Pro) deacylase [Opacimonas viscosa]MCP3428448.1 Cys-tRNA(Pro) deacylase [Opacimonas viscosa]